MPNIATKNWSFIQLSFSYYMASGTQKQDEHLPTIEWLSGICRSNMSGMHWEYEFNFHLHGVYIVEDSRALASVVDYSRSLLSSTYGLWKK